ncbi:TPA_asm: XRE family transcriptional regulator [Listeria monocytogenes]|uniref:helix-turn-helix domain-containing protein n=1 Tax=Listeria monocytogenes TaxID=1639 RepID=UPI000869FB3F|nr:helix-turn-helix domain-containing protein [Listeria monocytogenes]EAE7387734.1 XRE family transcriptional regulator [Listeria monocytogenes]EAF2344330.1 XRE family transcriptional regulator [Listeria monocytogenes]EAF6954199.1 XRE family transcriptional regulator [Listeria monocytogenes]EAG6825402.1 XRE family transcriptional regulator [Listeria monocytogenes]EGB4157264.1 helix-turn-helix domain-containing protein [Listeria monocytogenes]
MSFSYSKLWKLIIDRKINKTQLRDSAGITNTTLAKLSKDETVSMDSLARICRTLECDISDIVEYINEGIEGNGKKI